MPQRLNTFLVLLCLVVSGCASQITKAERAEHLVPLDEGLALMNKRVFKKALERFASASRLEPSNPEPYFYKGLSLFRMDRYQEAAAAFRETLKISPEHYQALPWLWAARLEGSKSNLKVKEAIEKEIAGILQSNPNNPEALFAVYLGYRHLKQEEKGTALIKELAPKVEQEGLRETVTAYLLEEMIGERKPEKRLELADIYFTSFPEGRGADTAAGILFHAIGKMLQDEALLKEYMEKYEGKGRHLNLVIASWLIKKEWDLERAVKLLETHLDLLADPARSEKPEFMSEQEWRAILKRQKADCLYLLGVAYFKQDDFSQAREYFERSKSLYNRNEKLHYYLAKIFIKEDKKEEALFLLKRSLEIGDRAEESAQLLTELLKSSFNHQGKPRDYFARLEEVTTFEDVTVPAGLAEIKAMRAAWGDYNKDGFEDILLDGPRLFRNNGAGKFEEVTKAAGLDVFKGFNGGVWGDYNNDGWLDIFLTSHKTNKLLKNNQQGAFIDVTDKAFSEPSENPTEAAAWGDMDNNGFLDIYVANYQRKGVVIGLGVRDRLFRNKGNGEFEDVTEKAGIISDEAMCGRGVVWADFNHDGLLDIYVSNYRLDPNFLWLNQGGSSFVDTAQEDTTKGHEVAGDYGNTIASVFGDLDNDGDLDLFCSNLAHPRYIEFSDRNMLLMNSGAPSYQFADSFPNSGISFEETSAVPTLGDIDNDGDLDLFVSSIYPKRNNHLYINDGKAHFTDITWLSGTRVKNAWGCAFADYDQDGDLDLLVASSEGIHLFMNNLLTAEDTEK